MRLLFVSLLVVLASTFAPAISPHGLVSTAAYAQSRHPTSEPPQAPTIKSYGKKIPKKFPAK